MVFTMGVSLYSTRIVLSSLGSLDYGIYNLVAGIVAMLSFLNSAMSVSTQRYLSFYKGNGDIKTQSDIFINSFFLHIIIGLLVVSSLEFIGIFLFEFVLKIPVDRFLVAKRLFHFMSATVFFTIVIVPFTALLNAYENFTMIAIVNVLESVLKLTIAFSVSWVTMDKLTYYGILTASISVISFLLYFIYCFKSYTEAQKIFHYFSVKTSILKSLTSFAGWNLFGALCFLGRTQGVAIILNVFYGTIINSSYAISNQVSAQFNFFASTFMQVINPQIMKQEGSGNRREMIQLTLVSCKYSFLLMSAICLPTIFEMEFLLKTWLKNIPENTVVFCQLILVLVLVNQLTTGIQSGLQATGKIKLYQIFVGSLILLNVPISFWILASGLPAYNVFIGFIMIEIIACGLRLFFFRLYSGSNYKDYYDKVLKPLSIPLIVTVLILFLINQSVLLPYRVFTTYIFTVASLLIAVYFFGLSKQEKMYLSNLFVNLKSKFLSKNF